MTRIETARLILRRPVAGDLPAYEAYCSSDRTRFTGGPYTRKDAFEKLAAMIGHWEIRGFAYEAARAYLDEVAAKGVFQTLFARVDANNHRSRTLALRLGACEDTGATAPDWMSEALSYRFDFKS